MTTVAFDGRFMAADSQAVDAWGMKERNVRKIHYMKHVVIGGAGESGQIQRWTRTLRADITFEELLELGYPDYVKDSNDPSLLVVPRDTRNVYRHVSGLFMPCGRPFHAIGSGRDYALAAMACGKTAQQAVEIAMAFDNGTGGEIIVEEV
jgi:ATP-dependent protease HslVU (ClpYQ) peptidase subunit